ncbi:hypothetical protein AKJ16_DCAP06581 [Drosera capensis]
MSKTQARDSTVPPPGYPTEESSTMKVEKKKKGWFRSLMRSNKSRGEKGCIEGCLAGMCCCFACEECCC